MDALAPEVLEHILSQVPIDSSPKELSATLSNCSLVSHNWRAIAQPLLFSEFIRYGGHYNPMRLYRTLLSHPRLQDLVKCIWVDTAVLSITSDSDSFIGRLQEQQFSRSVIDLFHQLTSRPRPGLHHLIVDFVSEELEAQNLKIVASLISSPNLTVLSFTNVISAPIVILYQCPSIRELHLCRCSFSGFDRDGDGHLVRDETSQVDWAGYPPPSKDRPRLSHLYLESTDIYEIRFIRWFLHLDCAFDISGLKTFHLLDASDEFDSYTLARDLVQKVSPSLEEFAFDPPTAFTDRDIYSSPEYATFDPLPELRTLKLSLQQTGVSTGSESSLWTWAIQFMSGLAHPERLEEIQFVCSLAERVRDARGWEELDLFLTSVITDPEDEELSGGRKVWNLKRIWFGIVTVSDETTRLKKWESIAAIIPSLVPRIWGLGLVKVSLSNNWGHVHDSDCWYEG
ncbi:hypothetical protein BDN72DRAFT_902417 [Pluteus cervinus]|uniref:Uncharacterized protein n=1 Tax=Pluteus cervinus TaxID=181527 RepID=A0ACD3ACN1_9AGAR|nr:hypothetical protein BDN72DRAFT_902417 [Pluteus cervinus]